MATQVQFRGGTTTEHASFNGAAREVTVDTTKQTLVVQDGTTNGGYPLQRENGSQSLITTGDISIDSDSSKLKIGDDGDLELFFDGSNSYIKESAAVAGQLIIDGWNGVDLRQGETGDLMIRAVGGGGVTLYWDASPKLETHTDKVLFKGHAKVGTDNTYDIGASGARWKDLFISGTGIINADPTDGANQGIELSTSGYIEACNTSDSYYLWKGYKQGSSTLTSSIKVDGTGNFTSIGINTTPTTPLHVKETAQADVAIFECSHTGNWGSQISLKHSTTSPADDDMVGSLSFDGKDDGGNNTTYAQIRSYATDVSNNAEDGVITFHTRNHSAFGERMRLTHDGNLSLGDGNLVVANGRGIDFSSHVSDATGMSSETLDDYEIGSWTPVFKYLDDSNVWQNCSFTNNLDYASGRYVKVGNICHGWYYTGFCLMASTASNKSAQIHGLPFNFKNGEPYYGGTVAFTHCDMFSDGTNAVAVHNGYFNYNQSVINPTQNSGVNGAKWNTSGNYIMVSFTYETN